MAPNGNNVMLRAGLDADAYAPHGRSIAMDMGEAAELDELAQQHELAAADAHHMAEQHPGDPDAYVKGAAQCTSCCSTTRVHKQGAEG